MGSCSSSTVNYSNRAMTTTSTNSTNENEEENGGTPVVAAAGSATATNNYPIVCNDEGASVSFGDDDGHRHLVYCEGQSCSPRRGQCSSCSKLQEDPKRRMDLLRSLFPTLEEGVLVGALRNRRGDVYESARFLIDAGAPHIPFAQAFPKQEPRGSNGPARLRDVGDDHVSAVQNVLGHDPTDEYSRLIVVSALRQQNADEDRLVQATIGHIFDSSEEDLQRAVTRDAERQAEYDRYEVTREQAWQERLEQRNRSVEELRKVAIPDSVLELAADPFAATESKTTPNNTNDGHVMVDYSDSDGAGAGGDGSDDAEAPYCRVCASQVPGRFTGSRMCQTCKLCEGCVSFGIVFSCPMVGNGGHLYPRPLAPLRPASSRRGNSCNVRGEGCLGSTAHHGRYISSDGGFNVCRNCIAKDAPPNYDWQKGQISAPPPSSQQPDDTKNTPGTVPALLVERAAAAIWEGKQMDDNNDDSGPGFIIGREIDAESDDSNDDSDDEDTSNPVEASSAPARLLKVLDQKPLPPEESRALQIFSSGTSVAASDIHHAENILLQAQKSIDANSNSSDTRNYIRNALLAGKVGIAGTLLLAHRYAPKKVCRKRKGGSTDINTNGAMVCFCGDVIGPDTAAVGCLNGHGMHPGCAADHLLGGGGCPFCNSPLFFPNISAVETGDAHKLAMAEIEQRKCMITEETRIQDEQLTAQGLDFSPKMNDLVQISSDVNLCAEEVTKYPERCGWNRYMESACGMVGCVTKIEQSSDDATKVAFHIRTKSGPNSSSIEHWWTPSVLTVVCRATSKEYALFEEAAVDDKEILAAAVAENHIYHLRAELKVLVAARAAVDERSKIKDGTSGSVEVPTSDLQCLQETKGIVSHFDWCRAKHLVCLVSQWSNTGKAEGVRQSVYDTLRQGDIDSASRIIRKYNTAQVIEDLQWIDTSKECREYLVEKFAKVALLAWPSASAPKTGYFLEPRTRFVSPSEVFDDDGNSWLKIDEKSFTTNQLKKYHGAPPQGWLCTKPGGTNLPAVVKRAGSALCCFGCGDNHFPVCQPVTKYSPVKKNDSLSKGDELLVAATLEPVSVVSLEDDVVVCSFSNCSTNPQKKPRASLENHSFQVRYRRKDLVYPGGREGNSSSDAEECVRVNGRLCGRRELINMHGSPIAAREVWEEAKGGCIIAEDGDYRSGYASCVRGHILHARCFQAALLAGEGCPAPGCAEPLWVPKVRRTRSDDDTCCGANNSVVENVLEDQGGGNFLNSQSAPDANLGIREGELKMCPVCYSGPFLHERCSDMAAHHGQCVARALGGTECSFAVSSREMAKVLMELPANQSILDALPRCPTHNIPVLFNGCTNCGHVFTQTSWDDLPDWDRSAKAALDVDKEKREQAKLFAMQIREEASILQFERDALENTWGEAIKEDSGKPFTLPPIPPPLEMLL